MFKWSQATPGDAIRWLGECSSLPRPRQGIHKGPEKGARALGPGGENPRRREGHRKAAKKVF
jgi:hypothetical protein